MILFESVQWKNFLSTGNSPIKVDLNRSDTTLIIGKNGEGKSTILDALCYGLFGKAFRNVKKLQLVNSINRKNTEVQVVFTIHNKQYKIIRTIKPTTFEIWCDGELINQDAAIKDYQKVLEQQILKLNYKTFTQVVILGSASFVPFMQLPSSQRRDVIEDILDIRIFSTMNQILKEKASDTKSEILRIESEIANSKTKLEAQSSIIQTITDAKDNNIKRIREKIKLNTKQAEETQVEVDELIRGIEVCRNEIADKDKVVVEEKQAVLIQGKLNNKVEHLEHHKDFFNNNDVCPSCSQGIPHEHKETIMSALDEQVVAQNVKLNELESILESFNSRLKIINTTIADITEKNIQLSTKNSAISLINKQIADHEHDIKTHQTDTTNIDEEKDKLKNLAETAMSKVKEKTELREHRNLEEVASVLLKDTGIKTAIIREYLPVMNKLINKYLQSMDAYIHFELDEAFNEIVKSRFRDEFTYASFSEGEKMRIDLAILFTWRQIAKMKNSVNTNLLLLDEIFDSSLDTSGTDYFLNLMNSFGDNTNIFVISHKGDQLFDKFRSVIKFEKRNDFSVIVKG